MSPEHPLAGVTLRFDVTIRDVRDATPEEVAHGHAHGPDGHAHGPDGHAHEPAETVSAGEAHDHG